MNPRTVMLRILFLLGMMAIAIFAHNASAGVRKPERSTAKKISTLITKYAKKYKLERTYLSCLYKIESSYILNTVSKTHDHGIGQINERTAIMLKMNVEKLTTDLEYSIDKSAGMLAYYKWLKALDEPRTWVCRYNIGPGPLELKNRSSLCEDYLAKFYKCTTSKTLVGVL